MAPCGLSVSWMWPKVDILLKGSFANLPCLIAKLEEANVVCAGASLTIPGLLCNPKHPLLGALTWNQLAEVQLQVDDIQLELREAPDRKAQPLFSQVKVALVSFFPIL